MSDYCENIINCLIEQRKRKNMTQKQLAEAAQLSQPVIARLESKRVVPQLDTLLRIATALDCKLEIVST